MKLKIDYEITEFTADDADDKSHTRNIAMNAAATVYVAMLDTIERESERVLQDRLDEHRRWARFLHYCHTGRMVS